MKYSIKALRINANLNLKEASALLNIAPKTLISYENGSVVPNFSIVKRMCEIYKCDLNDIRLT